MSEDPAAEVLIKLFDDEARERLSVLGLEKNLERVPVLLNDLVKSCLLGLMALVGKLLRRFLDHGTSARCFYETVSLRLS